ncbi:MAG: trypsin-like peptidase domain-containing protein [Bradymonadaceae bacterium]|nr:trypsin-like peptidase domain-containing protein [Lujinxingiaceae bacterium]
MSLTTLVGCEQASNGGPLNDTVIDTAPDQEVPAAKEPVVAVEPTPVAVFPDFADVVERAHPAVVNIYTRTTVVTRPSRAPSLFHPDLVPRERVQQSLGSGFLIAADGLVLTNEHVIRNANEIAVRLLDERWFHAEVVGKDPKTDIALLRLREADDLPFLELGDSDGLRVGSWVIAIGNPLGLTSTVTVGIASAVGRRALPVGGELHYQDFIQTDASINPGNSGGPLLDIRGKVIGINTAVIAGGQGLGFSIPINMVRDILPSLQAEGRVRRSWLGIYVGDVPQRLREAIGLGAPGGALVTRVVVGGPADRAGMRAGDVVLRIDQKDVADASRLTWIAANLGIGRTVPVEIRRGDEAVNVELTLAALPE